MKARLVAALRMAARQKWHLDVAVLAGIALVGEGAGELHQGLAPIVWGLGLIAAVRWGA